MVVKSIAHHRNGICGEPFHVALIEEDGRQLVAVRFYKEPHGCAVAVLDVAMLAQGNITFGENSWRGDHYVDAIDAAIAAADRPRPCLSLVKS